MIKKVYLTLPLLIFLNGCANKPDVYVENTLFINNTSANTNKINLPLEKKNLPLEKNLTIIEEVKNNSANINKKIMHFYNEWKDVKYKFGGNSKKGIDCSAFTQRIYKEKFNIKIPRTTRTQVKAGKEITKAKLELGDLIFFKTGKVDRHVGVYMGNGDFMHASIKGVKLSKVDKPFYKKAYWTSRRIID